MQRSLLYNLSQVFPLILYAIAKGSNRAGFVIMQSWVFIIGAFDTVEWLELVINAIWSVAVVHDFVTSATRAQFLLLYDLLESGEGSG